MRKLITALGLVVGVAVLLFGSIAVLSESGEVVVLQTSDAEGHVRATRLWVVDDGGYAWLRAGQPESRWYRQLAANPDVSLTRGDATHLYRAVPVDEPAARERLNALMAEKYGLADRLIGVMADRSQAVPIRLEPR